MPTHRAGRTNSPSEEWNSFVLRFLMQQGQESERHARRLAALESVVLRLCEDAPPTASFALHKAASDLRAEALRHATETQGSGRKVEELAAMAYRFLSQDEPARSEAKAELPPSGKAAGKRPAPLKKKAQKKPAKKKR